jgi:hypothetical protein
MAIDIAQEKQQVHQLVDHLAPIQVAALRNLLETMVDPVARALALAPIDDEPLTPEELKALDEADEWLKHHKATPHEEFLAELGITKEEIDNFQETT